MSRVTYSDYDALRTGRWLGCVKRVLNGKRGREHLRELRQALQALPKQRLIANRFVDAAGDVCPLGALALYKGIRLPDIFEEDAYAVDDWSEHDLNVSCTFAWLVQELADETLARCTPERRYELVQSWIEDWLTAPDQSYSEYRAKCLP